VFRTPWPRPSRSCATEASPSRWPRVSRWVCSAVLVAGLAAGCGGASAGPKLPAGVGAALERQTKAVETALGAGDTATAQQQAAALVSAIDRAVAAGQVPGALQDELRAGAQRLLSLVSGTAEPPPPEENDQGDGNDNGKKKGHKKKDSPSATAPTTTTTTTDTTPTTTDTTPTTTGTGL
jgi:ribonuclease HI